MKSLQTSLTVLDINSSSVITFTKYLPNLKCLRFSVYKVKITPDMFPSLRSLWFKSSDDLLDRLKEQKWYSLEKLYIDSHGEQKKVY
jgi:hypothetical protein